jgi:hypothetical protein
MVISQLPSSGYHYKESHKKVLNINPSFKTRFQSSLGIHIFARSMAVVAAAAAFFCCGHHFVYYNEEVCVKSCYMLYTCAATVKNKIFTRMNHINMSLKGDVQ